MPIINFNRKYGTDKMAIAFLCLAVSYLALGLIIGVVGAFQYLSVDFLKQYFSFEKTRPLHVYLVISWIFTAAQGGVYFYLPRLAKRNICWINGVKLHFFSQLFISILIVSCFFLGKFGGREYLEFPPWLGLCVILSWIPFAINFFKTLKPDYRHAPVYVWSWSCGIVFFLLTMTESYLWVFDFFRTNIVRDLTVQWKALGAMVGSWNMLIYGSSMFIMERMNPQSKVARGTLPFFFFFLGLTNLMFNWGHHTYIVPAAAWVKNVSYIISMTELLILGYIIMKWRKTFSEARKNYHIIPFRFLTFADLWIFLNLALAIIISIPAINRFTHGTHITVAHAMGATIGINTMILFASVFFILQKLKPELMLKKRRMINRGIHITNIALLFFWISLLGSGITRIQVNNAHESFYTFLEKCRPFFKMFAYSGVFIFIGLALLVTTTLTILLSGQRSVVDAVVLNKVQEVS